MSTFIDNRISTMLNKLRRNAAYTRRLIKRRGIRILISFKVRAQPEKPEGSASSRRKHRGKGKARMVAAQAFLDEDEDNNDPPIVTKTGARKKMVVPEEETSVAPEPVLFRKKNTVTGRDLSSPRPSWMPPAARSSVKNPYIPKTIIGTISEKEVVAQGSGIYYSAKERKCTCVGLQKKWCSCNPVEAVSGSGPGWKVEREVEREVSIEQRTRRSKPIFKLE